MKKTTVRFDPEMWRQVRIRAIDEGISFQDLLERALQLYLKTSPKRERRGKETR